MDYLRVAASGMSSTNPIGHCSISPTGFVIPTFFAVKPVAINCNVTPAITVWTVPPTHLSWKEACVFVTLTPEHQRSWAAKKERRIAAGKVEEYALPPNR
jgi:hypothetical protein